MTVEPENQNPVVAAEKKDIAVADNQSFSWCLFDPDVGTEELGHLEMVAALVHQLTRNLKDAQIENSNFAPYFVDHTAGVFPTSASGNPWNANSIAVKGDPIADLTEDLAADGTTVQEQRG